MAEPESEAHGPRTCRVEVSPTEVDAGAEVTVRVIVTGPHEWDLTGDTVSIRNQAGEEVASEELTEVDEGDVYATPEIVLEAPRTAGNHTYTAVLPALDQDGLSDDEVLTEFSVVVKAHTAHLNVWGMPSAIPTGERFGLKVSMKCSSGCKLTGRELDIVDDKGAEVGKVTLGEEPWPGTNAVYYAEFETDAPAEPGDRKWSVRVAATDTGLPHAAGSFAFPVRVVTSPDFEVTVEAIDSEKRVPIKGLHVLMHPYRGITDENGVARVKVAKGTYKLQVSGFKYISHQAVIDADSDVTARVELKVEPPPPPPDWH
jgi:hypothetical protein